MSDKRDEFASGQFAVLANAGHVCSVIGGSWSGSGAVTDFAIFADDQSTLLGGLHIHHSARVGGEPEQRGFDGDPIEPVIHPTAKIGPYATVDGGINRPTEIGARSWVFAHAHVGHDTIIGEDVEVATGVVIGGGSYIADGVRIGINATILPRQVIGKGARVGAGAVVTKDVPPGATVIGNPARPI